MQGCYIQRDIYKPTQTTNHHLTTRELTPMPKRFIVPNEKDRK